MSNFSEHEDLVRVDFFKPSGKWVTTREMQFLAYSGDIHDWFRRSINSMKGSSGYQGLTAVCLEPYHEHAHPIMLKVGG